MKYKIYYDILRMAYKGVLRDLLIKTIDDPNTEWDNILLETMDKIFGYETA